VAKYPAVKINGIVRNASKIPDNIRAISNINIFEASSGDKTTLTKALKGSQVCICCYLGDNDLMTDGQKLLINCCIEVGVPRYIASDWSSEYRTVELGEIPMKDPMKLVNSYLQEKEAQGSNIRGVHVLTGAFMEVVLQRIFADDAHTTMRHFGSGDEGIDVSAMPDVAAWTAEVAMDPTAAGVIEGT
jgi:hypothetical protein